MLQVSNISKHLKREIKNSIKKEADILATELNELNVIDTGQFLSSFHNKDGETLNTYEIRITNDAVSDNGFPYPHILAGGRRPLSNGRMGGSINWKLGLMPMVIDLRDRIEKVKI